MLPIERGSGFSVHGVVRKSTNSVPSSPLLITSDLSNPFNRQPLTSKIQNAPTKIQTAFQKQRNGRNSSNALEKSQNNESIFDSHSDNGSQFTPNKGDKHGKDDNGSSVSISQTSGQAFTTPNNWQERSVSTASKTDASYISTGSHQKKRGIFYSQEHIGTGREVLDSSSLPKSSASTQGERKSSIGSPPLSGISKSFYNNSPEANEVSQFCLVIEEQKSEIQDESEKRVQKEKVTQDDDNNVEQEEFDCMEAAYNMNRQFFQKQESRRQSFAQTAEIQLPAFSSAATQGQNQGSPGKLSTPQRSKKKHKKRVKNINPEQLSELVQEQVNFMPQIVSENPEQIENQSVCSSPDDNFTQIATKAAYQSTSLSTPQGSPSNVNRKKNNETRQRIVKISDSLGYQNTAYKFGKTTNNTPTSNRRKKRGSIHNLKNLHDDQIWSKFNQKFIGMKQKRKQSQILKRSGSINDLKFESQTTLNFDKLRKSSTNSQIVFAINQLKGQEVQSQSSRRASESSNNAVTVAKHLSTFSPQHSQRSYNSSENQLSQTSFIKLNHLESGRIRIQSFTQNNNKSNVEQQHYQFSSMHQKSKFSPSKENKKSRIQNSQYAKYYKEENEECDLLSNFNMEKYMMQIMELSNYQIPGENEQQYSGLSLNLQPMDGNNQIQQRAQQQQQQQEDESYSSSSSSSSSSKNKPQQTGNQIKFNFGSNSNKKDQFQVLVNQMQEQQPKKLSLGLQKIQNEDSRDDDSASQSGHVTSADTQAGCSEQLHLEHMVNMYKALVYLKDIAKPTEEQVAKKRITLPRLQDPNKKTIVFDLDETLIHCVDNIQKEKPDKILLINIPGSGLKRAGINIRPYTQQTLQFAHKHFQVLVFTASHRAYADAVLDYLDPHQQYIDYRLYREHCVQSVDKIYMKDLRVLGNRDLSKVTIIDNHVYSFGFQLDNGIPILPFYDDKNDIQLTFLISYFKKLLKAKDCRSVHKKHFEFSELLKYNIENFVKFYDDEGSSDEEESQQFDMRAITMNTMSSNNQNNQSNRNSNVSHHHHHHHHHRHHQPQNIQEAQNEATEKDDSSGTSCSFSRDIIDDLNEQGQQNLEGDAGSGSVDKPAISVSTNNNRGGQDSSSSEEEEQEDKENNLQDIYNSYGISEDHYNKNDKNNPYMKKKSFCINLYASITRTQSSKSQEQQQYIVKLDEDQKEQKDDDLTNFKSPDYLQNQNKITRITNNTPKHAKHHHQTKKDLSSFLQNAPSFSLFQIDKEQNNNNKSSPLIQQRKENKTEEEENKKLVVSNSEETDNLSRLISKVIDSQGKSLSKSLKSNKHKEKTKKGAKNQYHQFYKKKNSFQHIRSTQGSDSTEDQQEINIGMQFISNFFQKNLKLTNEKSVEVGGNTVDVLPKLSKSSFSSIQSTKAAKKRRFSRKDDEDDDDDARDDQDSRTRDLNEERKNAFQASFGKKQDRRGTQP